MAKDPEENANEDRVEEEDLEDEEDREDSDEDEESGDDEEGDEEDDADEGDSDDEAPLPKNRKELYAIVRAAVKRAQNRNNAGERHRRNRNLTDKERTGKSGKDSSLKATVENLQVAEQKRQFGYAHNLAPDEVDLVYRMDPRPSAKTLKDPAVKGALEGLRTHRRAKDNIPSSNGRTFKVGGKDYKDLKPEEKSAHFADRRRQILDGKQGRGR